MAKKDSKVATTETKASNNGGEFGLKVKNSRTSNVKNMGKARKGPVPNYSRKKARSSWPTQDFQGNHISLNEFAKRTDNLGPNLGKVLTREDNKQPQQHRDNLKPEPKAPHRRKQGKATIVPEEVQLAI